MKKDYLGDITHKFDPKFYEKIYRFVENCGLLYLSVNKFSVKGVENLKGLEEPLIFFSNHESHFDYVLLSYTLYKNFSIAPRIAAGMNLFVTKIVGESLRKLGAFCVDRENKSRDYIEQLEDYVINIILNNESTLTFIQGTRAGNLRAKGIDDVFSRPKTGLVDAPIKAQERTNKNLLAVPIFIDYDSPPEKRIFKILGMAKKIENELLYNLCYYGSDLMAFLLRWINLIKGGVYVNFGKPFSLKDYLKEVKEEPDRKKRKGLADKIAEEIKKLSLED